MQNARIITSPVIDLILNLAAVYEGELSVSFLAARLREENVVGLPCKNDFESALEQAGFTLTRIYNKNGRTVRTTLVGL